VLWLQPSMLVVPDIQDVYTPRQTDLLVPLTEVNISLPSLVRVRKDIFPLSVDKSSVVCLNIHVSRAISSRV